MSGIFISETELPNEIIKSWNKEEIVIKSDILKEDEFKYLLDSLKSKVRKESKILVKSIKGNLEGLINGIMYSNLNDKKWSQAAYIVEIFRHPDISKNSSSIDTLSFQKKIYSHLTKGDLKFILSWGQAKRSCGGLKTEGYSADFAELYAILRLQVIANSIHIISGKQVNILVLTGGNRFNEALFTHEEKIKKYDEQRSLIANFFSDQNASITFRLYKKNIEGSKLSFFSEKIDSEEINKNFKVILVNIDWHNVLSDYNLNCHGVSFPDSLSKYLNNGGDKNNIIIMAIVSILRNDTHKYWIEKIGDVELFDDTIDYFREVTKQSVIKYLSIHLIGGIENNSLYDDYIRLTVHIKSDRNYIPAIYNLGRMGGNKLSQHICFSVINGVMNFETILEIRKNKDVKKYFPPASEGMLFNWLNFENQPLLYSDDENLFADILSIPLIKI